MRTKIKYDNINYIKLKYHACFFTPRSKYAPCPKWRHVFFYIYREVATTILCYFVLVPESIVRLCDGLGLLSHTVKQVFHFRHFHASYLTRFWNANRQDEICVCVLFVSDGGLWKTCEMRKTTPLRYAYILICCLINGMRRQVAV
jgi:hypothetical protein